MSPEVRVDPYPDSNFLVEIDGITRGGFRAISGLEEEIPVSEYAEGGDAAIRKLKSGKLTNANLVLTNGLTRDRQMYDWFRECKNGNVVRKNISVIALDEDNKTEVARWNVYSAWPVKYTGPEFAGENTGTAVEVLELANEGKDLIN